MTWNIAAECVSTIFLCILWTYSRKGNLVPTLKNRLFQASFLTTFCAMTTNILSTVLIYHLRPETLVLTWVVTMIYFAATPLMGLVYFFYTAANLFEGATRLGRYFVLAAIPGGLYLLLCLLNPLTHHLFDITSEGGYVQGPLIALTYLIFYLYCLASVIVVLWQGKRVAPAIRLILFTFPIIAGIVIIVQQIYPTIILSGAAATSALLIIYLYLQNKQISIDYLTQLPNRHEFLKMLELYLRKKYSFSIVVLSLRDFKTINDVHGQHSGDQLLAAVGTYLRKEMHLKEWEIYRYDGDEFALLLRDGNAASLRPVVEQLLERMNRAWDVPGCTCLLSSAIGIVNCPETTEDMAGLINGLEYAVLQGKRDAAHHNVCYCTPELLEKFKRRHLVAEDMEEGLRGDCFELYYQPIYSVPSHSFLKAEALLRMQSPRLGRVFPDEFIPVAEESGLIIELTYLVLDMACQFVRRMMDAGIEPDSINVNFSALQFTQKDLIPRMLEIIDGHQVPRSKIKIELTESSVAENMEEITAYLEEINGLGIRIGLDDFGTGYSNLISVLDLPIDTVKLDKSLVWSAMKNRRCSIAVQNFARAFRELGMTVLAEGVETEEQRDFVVDAGCSLIQGFLYAKPMPEADYVAFLQEQAACVPSD